MSGETGDDGKSTLEMALVRLYRFSANEQPSKSMDARILKKSRRVIYTSSVFPAHTAIAAGVVLLVLGGTILMGKLTIGAFSHQPRNSVLGPWVPLQAQVDGSSWPPPERDSQLLGSAKYKLMSTEFTGVSLGDDDDGRIDLRGFASQARERLAH